MAERFYSGRDGTLWLDRGEGSGLVQQHKVRDWTLQSSLSLLEITTLGDHHKDYTPGVVGYSGSATLLYYKGSDNKVQVRNWLRDAGMGTQTKGVTDDEQVTLSLRIHDDTTSFRRIDFKAYITSASLSVTVGDIVSTQFSFTSCGRPTTVTL